MGVGIQVNNVAESHEGKPQDYFKPYEEHAKTLRTWLVTYGIGAPVLFLSNEKLTGKLIQSSLHKVIVSLFLLGVALQVLLALVNKHTMWACYYGTIDKPFSQGRRYKFASFISSQYWIDFICDIVAVVAFIVSTYLVFKAILS